MPARPTADVHGFRVVATSFGVLFLAEWGDLSQLLTAGLAARYQDPVSVFVGSWLALVTVAGLRGAARAGRCCGSCGCRRSAGSAPSCACVLACRRGVRRGARSL